MDEIQNLIFKFANSFDLKDWNNLSSLFLKEISCDYMDLRGVKEVISKEEYVAKRKESLSTLKTQHIFSNLEIYISDVQATCRCSALILRNFEKEYFNTHAIYEFIVQFENNAWHIAAIKQTVLWNEGNPKIHSGVLQRE